MRTALIVIFGLLLATLTFMAIRDYRFEQHYGTRRCMPFEYSHCQYYKEQSWCPSDAPIDICVYVDYCAKLTCMNDPRPWYKQF